ncbi:MAG: DedA family protein [Candidatus Ozemobacteraceae bacterium]
MGLPVPEEVTFILAGYSVAKIPHGSLKVMIVISMLGLFLGDTLLFLMGRRFGLSLMEKWPFRMLFTRQRIERSKKFFKDHGSKAVLMAGFFAGIRATTFFLSAAMGISYFQFMLCDFTRAIVTCPISIWAGYHFGQAAQEWLEEYFFWVVGALAVMAVVFTIQHRQRKKEIARGKNSSSLSDISDSHP